MPARSRRGGPGRCRCGSLIYFLTCRLLLLLAPCVGPACTTDEACLSFPAASAPPAEVAKEETPAVAEAKTSDEKAEAPVEAAKEETKPAEEEKAPAVGAFVAVATRSGLLGVALQTCFSFPPCSRQHPCRCV